MGSGSVKDVAQQSWERARAECQAAMNDFVEGRPEPYKAVWSRSDDVVIMGAYGAYAQGWEQVAARLDRVSPTVNATGFRAENVLTVVGEDLACTVDMEHMERTAEGQTYHRVLRCTHVYRLEDEEWKVIVRHADQLSDWDASRA